MLFFRLQEVKLMLVGDPVFFLIDRPHTRSNPVISLITSWVFASFMAVLDSLFTLFMLSRFFLWFTGPNPHKLDHHPPPLHHCFPLLSNTGQIM